jgi:rod shape-determining protein MreC
VRNVAYGQPSTNGDGLELRYTLANADIVEGDLLTTSGVDGVYPPGLPVARVTLVERRAESSFTRIGCEPLARVQGALHVLVLAPVGPSLPPSRPPTSGPMSQRNAPGTAATAPRSAP